MAYRIALFDADNTLLDFSRSEREAVRICLAARGLPTDEDTVAMNYQGFDIVIPANITAEKPYICLRREGKYYIDIGDSDMGAFMRIDHFFEKFEDHLKKLSDTLLGLRIKKADLKKELDKKVSYADTIEELKRKLENLDKELGVEKI